MRVLAWVLVWVVLLAASGWYLWRCLRRLFRTAGRFAHELAEAERCASAGSSRRRGHGIPAMAARLPTTLPIPLPRPCSWRCSLGLPRRPRNAVPSVRR